MHFVKMHGLGNDFIVVDEFNVQSGRDYNKLAPMLCDRHFGIGADGIVIVLPSDIADARMRIINADGSEAEMCGNGIRCFAKYVYESGAIKRHVLSVETLAGIIKPELFVEGGEVQKVKVDMGKPDFDPGAIPAFMPGTRIVERPLEVDGRPYAVTSMSMGVPHTVIFVDDVDKMDIIGLGSKIEKHPVFPKKTNVNFVEVLNDYEIKVRTWERGAGATLACGTGSCASAVAAATTGRTGREVTVHLMAGQLEIRWAEDDTVFMTGPATKVFQGDIEV
jgi:diaminopimelate epimerase